jgi:hypothetical protein
VSPLVFVGTDHSSIWLKSNEELKKQNSFMFHGAAQFSEHRVSSAFHFNLGGKIFNDHKITTMLFNNIGIVRVANGCLTMYIRTGRVGSPRMEIFLMTT